MCRLWGISYNFVPERVPTSLIAEAMFPELVHLGPDAYGWMSFNEATGKVTSRKYQGRCDTRDAADKMAAGIDDNARWFVGHTRKATTGSPKVSLNNHPIAHKDIIGVHNGKVWNYEEVLKITGRQNKKTKVDSEAIFAAVSMWGDIDGLNAIDADMVAIYADRKLPNTLRIARSEGRNLHIVWTERGNMIWCSEIEPLLRLEPWIRIKHETVLSKYRMITVVDGQIAARANLKDPFAEYRKEQAAAKAKDVPAPSVAVMERIETGVATESDLARFDEWYADQQKIDDAAWDEAIQRENQNARARKRGEEIFGPKREVVYSGGRYVTKKNKRGKKSH